MSAKAITPENTAQGIVAIADMGPPIAQQSLESGCKRSTYDRAPSNTDRFVPLRAL
jgi:hypothetical protein